MRKVAVLITLIVQLMRDLQENYDGVNPEKEYAHDIEHIKTRYRYDRIAIYTSPEFKILRERLIRICGKDKANFIMDKHQ